MGTITNIGNQLIIGDYQTRLHNKNLVNTKFEGFKSGIYTGLVHDRLNNLQITITPGVMFIQDTSANIQIRCQTQSTITHTVDDTKPYVIWRYVYADTVNWYPELRNEAQIDLLPDDIIICKCRFTGVNLNNNGSGFDYDAFDYNERSQRAYGRVATYALTGTKDGVNKDFQIPTSIPRIRSDQYHLIYNGLSLYETVDYTVLNQTITLGVDIDAPLVDDDLRAVVVQL